MDDLEILSSRLPEGWFFPTGSLWVGGFNTHSDIDFVIPKSVVMPMHRAYGTLNVGAARLGRLNLIQFANDKEMRDYASVNELARMVGFERGWDNKSQRIKFFRAMQDNPPGEIKPIDYTIPNEMGIKPSW